MTKRYYKYGETHRTVRGRRQKYCTKCKKWKRESEFGTDRAKRDGLKMRCRDCDRAYAQALHRKYRKGKKVRVYLRFEQRHRIVKGVKQKLCCKCKQWKDESHFYRQRGLKDGLGLECKKCNSKRYERNRKAGRRNLRYEDRHRIVNGIRQKFCRKCKRWKSESEFYKDRSQRDSLTERCRKCTYKATGRSRKKRRLGMRN